MLVDGQDKPTIIYVRRYESCVKARVSLSATQNRRRGAASLEKLSLSLGSRAIIITRKNNRFQTKYADNSRRADAPSLNKCIVVGDLLYRKPIRVGSIWQNPWADDGRSGGRAVGRCKFQALVHGVIDDIVWTRWTLVDLYGLRCSMSHRPTTLGNEEDSYGISINEHLSMRRNVGTWTRVTPHVLKKNFCMCFFNGPSRYGIQYKINKRKNPSLLVQDNPRDV